MARKQSNSAKARDRPINWLVRHQEPPTPDYGPPRDHPAGFAGPAPKSRLDEKLIAFNLLPETFTMKEVQELYETIYDKPFSPNNFQKKILDLNIVERLGKKYIGAANEAPYLYRFRR